MNYYQCSILCLMCFHTLGIAVGYELTNEKCHMWKIDHRDSPEQMNQDPAKRMNLFLTATAPYTGRIQSIKYYAVREGTVFVSFWTMTSSNAFSMNERVELISTGNSLQDHALVDDQRVEFGQILGIHYTSTTGDGVISYQEDGTGIPLYTTRTAELSDTGWVQGTTQILDAGDRRKSAALHISICECKDGWYGMYCNTTCSITCLNSTACNKETGSCDGGCSEGYNYTASEFCDQKSCPTNCIINWPCNVEDVTCIDGCKEGFDYSASRFCDHECDYYHFGPGCEGVCHCDNDVACHSTSGICPSNACRQGWEGPTCSQRVGQANRDRNENNPGESNLAPLAGLIVVIIIALASLIVIILLIRKRYIRQHTDKPHLHYLEEKPTIRTIYENKVMNDVEAPKPDKDDVELEDEQETDEEENPYYNQAPIHVSKSRWIMVSKFHTTLMHTNQDTLPKEYMSIPKGQLKPWTFAANSELVQKNKFKNILPYDYNGVKLERINDDPLSEYINATKILGYDNSATIEFIASQGPQNHTVDDFWRLLWQYDVRVVVMVTNLIENMKIKCEQYWPDDGYRNFAGVQISLVKEEKETDIVTRDLKATKGSESRTMHQIHYVGWPDHGVPGSTSVIFSVLRSMRRLHKHPHPVVVHCSAGVGRTGTLIAIDQLVEEAGCSKRVDVLACVRRLREQRVNMVQTLPQYKFIYRALDEHFSLNEEQVIPITKAQEVFQALLNSDVGKAKLNKQFMFLEDTKPKPTADETYTALSEVNKAKNRDLDVIPTDVDRMMLETEDGEGNSYINAVEIQIPGEKSGYCVTQIPLEETVNDFWRLLVENNIHNVVYFRDNQKDIDKWMPREGAPLTLGSLTVECNEVRQVSDTVEVIEATVLRLKDQQTDIYVNVSSGQDQCEYANTAGQGGSEEVLRVRVHATQCLAVTDDAHMQAQRIQHVQAALHPHRVLAQPIITVCSNGAQDSGIFVACEVIAMQLKKHPTNIDIFNIVQILREKRPQLIHNMAQYRFLHVYALQRLTQSTWTTGGV